MPCARGKGFRTALRTYETTDVPNQVVSGMASDGRCFSLLGDVSVPPSMDSDSAWVLDWTVPDGGNWR